MEELTIRHVCAICQKKSCYVCPRCGINYCSLACYRAPKHEQCSESFYRDCCVNAMHNRYVDPENKSRMLEILRREASAKSTGDWEQATEEAKFPEEELQDEDSENSSDDFHSRFSDLNLESDELDADIIWARLTVKERREFHRLLNSGAIANYLPSWEPWWLQSKPNIEELSEANAASCANNTSLGKNKPIPLKKIFPSGKQPHASVAFVLAEVILAHVFLCRWYNGDCRDLVHEYLMHLCQLAPTLCCSPDRGLARPSRSVQEDTPNRTVILTTFPNRSAVQYKSLAEVLASLQLRLSDLRMPSSPQVLIVLLGDVYALLTKKDHLPRLFCELLDLIRLVRKKAQLEDSEEADISRGQIQTVYKKLQFLQSCLNPLDLDAQKWQSTALSTLQSQTTVELCRHVSDFDPNKTKTGNIRAAGPNWRNMIRSFPRNEEPLITDLDPEAKPG